MEFLIWMVVGYVVGAVPFGLLLTRLAGMGDIRTIGSGNIGATNVLRTGNKKLAALTLLLDGGKGAGAVGLYALLSGLFSYDGALYVGLMAVVGHCFPVWLKFKGGKGVATALGVFLAAVPLAGLLACGAWLAAAVVMRISSLSALIAMALTPVTIYFLYDVYAAQSALLIVFLVWAKHHENIKRLLKGAEPKIGAKK